jgi:hypothetical protein
VTGRTWATMTKRERLALLGESLKPEQRRPVMAAIEKFLRGKSTEDLHYTTNVMLRECWRHEHGNTEEWDRSAAAAGWVIR